MAPIADESREPRADRNGGDRRQPGGSGGGYHLARRGFPFVILDQSERVGEAWRKRWDSLRLFTPVRYCHLPGMRFPGPGSHYPSKDEVAAYLEGYARHLELPVRTGVRVDRVSKVDDHFEVAAGDEVLRAQNVIVATGAYHHPRVPPFAPEFESSIVQLHSKEYRNPSQIQDGDVLVVGAGNSGAEIAVELADHHRTWLAGPDTGEEPTRAGTLADRLLTPLMWFVATRFTVSTPLGRKLRDHLLDPPRGIPLGRVRQKDFAEAGIERVPRVIGVTDGLPVLEDGRVLEVANVIWCTGLRADYGWLDIPLPSRYGAPANDRCVVEACPGLYLMGLPFLHSISSALLGGVGRDAGYIVDHLAGRRHDLSGRSVAAAFQPRTEPV